MGAGFAANLAYFKLDFLDKDRVALKRAFREVLPAKRLSGKDLLGTYDAEFGGGVSPAGRPRLPIECDHPIRWTADRV